MCLNSNVNIKKAQNQFFFDQISILSAPMYDLERRIITLSSQILQYEDASLQEYARSIIPKKLYRCPRSTNQDNNLLKFEGQYLCEEADPTNGQADDDFVLSLAKWFKYELFSWVNKPKCTRCGLGGAPMEPQRTSPPATPLEHRGKASRVEVYKCTREGCGAVTRFPRFNDPKTLLSPEGRRGRCGEYANAFACVLRSVGYETRYVLDFTDHVWCEYFSYKQDRWVHVDPCEAKVDGCGIYEKGWGKKVSGVSPLSSASSS
jgi:peptide-N4-(N-acetyl-beta-glucosaminyl)asparagine amidase